jgi:hypothetical protein
MYFSWFNPGKVSIFFGCKNAPQWLVHEEYREEYHGDNLMGLAMCGRDIIILGISYGNRSG